MEAPEVWPLLLAVVLVVPYVSITPSATAHEGDGCAMQALVLQGECYDEAISVNLADPGPCDDPEWDGHSRVLEAQAASRNDVARLNRGFCALTFENLHVPCEGEFTYLRYRFEEPRPGEDDVSLIVDGKRWADGTLTQDGSTTFRDADLIPTLSDRSISEGSHSIELAWYGSLSQQLQVDYLAYECDPVEQCTNHTPRPPDIDASDGILEGRFGWAEHAYSFSSSVPFRAADPDGDPVVYRWSWGDGTTTEVPTPGEATHTFSSARLHLVELEAIDDPSARCPSAEPTSTSAEIWVFETMGPWQTQLDRPRTGQSCVEDRTVPSPVAHVMAGHCTIQASVGTGVALGAVIDTVCTRIDGTPIGCDSEAPFDAAYDGLDHDPGLHDLDACATAVGDKYDRRFCSATYAFVNPVGLDG